MVKSKQELIKEIEAIVLRDKVNYIDALLHYSNTHGLEPEYVGQLIRNTSLKSRVEENARELNFLEK